ncbi:MAG: SNF2-related protein, partial [Candidatus Sericytochromatia bacterium]
MDWDLKNWADPMTLKRGAAYLNRGAVGPLKTSTPNGPSSLLVEAEVDEGAIAPAQVRLVWDGKTLEAHCTCPMPQPCKHTIAVALTHLSAPKEEAASASGTQQGLRPGQEVLFYNLHVAPPPKKLEKQYTTSACAWLSIEKAVVMDDGLPSMPRPLGLWAPVKRDLLTAPDAAILDIIEPYYRAKNRDFSSPHAHGIPLAEDMVTPVFNQLARCPFVFGAGRQPVQIRPDLPVKDLGGPYETLWAVDGEVVAGQPQRLIGDPAGPWLQWKETFRPLVPAPEGEAEQLPQAVGPEGAEPPEEPPMHPAASPVPRLTLTEEGDRLLVRLAFRYGPTSLVTPSDPRRLVGGDLDGAWGFWERSTDEEAAIVARLADTALDSRGGGQYLAWGEAALTFLFDQMPALLVDGYEIFGEEKLRKLRVKRHAASVSVGVSSGIDWFDLKTVLSVDGEAVGWAAIKEAFKQNSRFVRLGSGAFARLPEEWLARQRALAESVGFAGADDGEGFTQQLPRYLAPAAADLLAAADSQAQDPDWSRFLEGLESIDALPEVETPPGFVGELRDYQKRGLARLSFWRDHGLHGILADDMGLGKTIQAIALVLSDKAAGEKGPSLLVAPTSVVYNWEQEIARFAPELKVIVLHGADRHTRYDALPEADVIVTSYGLLQRDRAVLLELSFNYVILDEAQKIKNPRSQAAKAASKIPARHRLCLTGTP